MRSNPLYGYNIPKDQPGKPELTPLPVDPERVKVQQAMSRSRRRHIARQKRAKRV